MSVVVKRMDNEEVIVFCKGADDQIKEKLVDKTHEEN